MQTKSAALTQWAHLAATMAANEALPHLEPSTPSLVALGAAWTLRHDAHVRVDVLYGRLSVRGRALVDLAGALLMLVPFTVLLLWASGSYVAASWRVLEASPDPGGLPRYPVKTLLPVACVLLLVQSVSFVIHRIAVLRGFSSEAS